MADTGWGELESEDELDYEDAEMPLPGTGHVYMHPFSFGEFTIRTSGDFIYHMQDIYHLYAANSPHQNVDGLWANLVQGLTNTADTDDMDAASFEFIMMTSTMIVDNLDGFDTITTGADVAEIELGIGDETAALLSDAVAELTLDAFELQPTATSFSVPDDRHCHVRKIDRDASASVPPLAPVCTGAKAKFLRLAAARGGMKPISEGRVDWATSIADIFPEFPKDSMDLYQEDHTILTSRSNSRPGEAPAVYVVYENGDCINVGSHGYFLTADADFELDFSTADNALDELFSAPGGELLTTPTPSHVLHQMASAVLSSALSNAMAVCEEDNVDIHLAAPLHDEIGTLNIDIATSAGIWNKSLCPTAAHPKYRYQCAISKYDMAAVIASECDPDPSGAFIKACANSLSVEFPAHYRVNVPGLADDLIHQSAIFEKLAMTSNRKMKSLGVMAYEAAVSEGLVEAASVDIHAQGMPWKDKRDILVKSLKVLECRSNVAFPPLPIGEIIALPTDSLSIMVGGHNFTAGPYAIQGRGRGPQYKMDDCSGFLTHYPASGIITESEAIELASILDESPLRATGQTHKGPSEGYKGKDSAYMSAAGEAYAASASAQLAEVRSDLVRAIYKLPMPHAGVWSQVYLYMGKVCCWYRCRDAPNSPDGYRIDWFCVSAFEVAGSIPINTNFGDQVFLWPRQRIRSKEMSLAHMGPRRLKLMLYSMLEKSYAARASHSDIVLAWERLITTLNSATYASGKIFLTARHLSSTLSAPSSPFHEMGKKLVDPVTYADVVYLERLRKILCSWVRRSQFRDLCPILGLPRSFSQAESYWTMWVPSEFADSNKNMASCIIALCDEAMFIELTMSMRVDDLKRQRRLLDKPVITIEDMRASLRSSCSLPTDGKLGWTWIGSLASGCALNLRSDASRFDSKYGRGKRARSMTDHLTVRHSTRIDKDGNLIKGTVAEMMLGAGTDVYLSQINQTFRFIFIHLPTFFNHPKGKEHKEREISITDPDSRIALTDAELLCGMYGKSTGVDFLKDSAKNQKFYRTSSRVLQKGGGIQSSDATRYGPNMSNMAIAIMLLFLGCMSTHLKWASVVYARLAYRKMLLPTTVKPALDKMCAHVDSEPKATRTLKWMETMPQACTEEGSAHVYYTTSHHMGQGMSHHSSSLLHAGGIVVAVDACKRTEIIVKGISVMFDVHIMVTSDDSTLLVEPHPRDSGHFLDRSARQIASRIFLQLVRAARIITLRMVSVLPNLVKEMISAIQGEFNSMDTGIGGTCPILGFRELISLMVSPSAPSLVGDYLNAHACARDVAFSGQGLSTGNVAHRILIDAIEERWSLNSSEKSRLHQMRILPNQLTQGCQSNDLSSSPASWLRPDQRAILYRMSVDKNVLSEDLDPHTRDTVFSPMMHVKVSMSKQHRKAISVIRATIAKFISIGKPHQAQMLEDSLRSTVSSARSRNLGRLAMRVRGKKLKPKAYLSHEFSENTMVEQTLNWLDFLEVKVCEGGASPDDIQSSNALAGYVRLVSAQHFGFPRPPRQRRHARAQAKKPQYRVGTYGRTPFGRHALERSGTVVVAAIGAAERESVQSYIAKQRHRMFSEHVEYGGSFVTSWACQESAVIVALDICGDVPQQEVEHIRLGSFKPRAIEKLADLSETHGIPVLALHRYDGVRGLWHAIHNGISRTVLACYDIDDHVGDAISHRHADGEQVLLALQGFDTDYTWNDTVPSREEVTSYQESAYDRTVPSVVRSIEDDGMMRSSVDAATYTTSVKMGDDRALVYIAPEISSTPHNDPSLRPHLVHLRAKVVSNLATGGYWHTALRGVCFRAFLKGHFYQNTVWTGGVIGWRLSSTSFPEYHVGDAHTTNVRALIIADGIDDPDLLSPFNTDIFSPGYKLVCESSTETYQFAHKVGREYLDLIVAKNLGRRYHVGSGNSQFLSLGHGPPPMNLIGVMPEDCENRIVAMLNDNGGGELW